MTWSPSITPRKISPPTTRGEANIPLMIILHASAVYTWRPDIVPARRARIQTSAVLAAGKRCEWIMPSTLPGSFDFTCVMWQSAQPCDFGG